MTTDKTGAQTTVNAGENKYTIAVEDQTVGTAFTADRDNQRVFYHTEIDDQFGERGLATILVEQALTATKDAGKRIVAVCPMVAGVLDKHPEFNDITDPVMPEIKQWGTNAANRLGRQLQMRPPGRRQCGRRGT